jgi:hypothetical protein
LRGGRSAGLAIAAWLAVGSIASAHRLDECLQAARIAIEPNQVSLELDVTPGIAVADAVIADIDQNRDGVLSANERYAYGRLVLGSVDLMIDGRPVRLTSASTTVPDVMTLRRGEGTIQLRSVMTISSQSTGAHQLLFRNRYRRDISVYLANALVPESDRIAVTAQRREQQQRELTIAYEVRGTRTAAAAWSLLGSLATVLAILVVKPGRRRRP